MLVAGEARTRRKKLWEVSTAYHCALIGTCLPMSTLRRLARRAGFAFPGDGSDYAMHHAAVHLASQPNELSRLIHKELDSRFGPAVENGEVAGSLWALMTHPLASEAMLQRASQDVHMLSHQIGASSRADLRRLAELEQENRMLREQLEDRRCKASERLAAKEQRIAELEGRLADAAGTEQRLREAEQRLRLRQEAPAFPTQPNESQGRRLDLSEARCARLERALVELHRECEAAERGMQQMLLQSSPSEDPQASTGLSGRRVLYVGGRTSLVEQYRLLVQRQGGELLHHDGGLEESLKRLQPLLAAADVVVCAAGQSSHAAYYVVKRFCKRTGKPCALLRRASLASLLNALRALGGEPASISAGNSVLLPAAGL